MQNPQAEAKKYKTVLCRHFETTGTCQMGIACRFAHGQTELRQSTYAPQSTVAINLIIFLFKKTCVHKAVQETSETESQKIGFTLTSTSNKNKIARPTTISEGATLSRSGPHRGAQTPSRRGVIYPSQNSGGSRRAENSFIISFSFFLFLS